MSTHVTTHHPVRNDLAAQAPTTSAAPAAAPPASPTRPGRRWAWAGVGAAVVSTAGTFAAFSLGAVYDPALAGDAEGIAADLAQHGTAMVVFHVLVSIGAVLMAVFGIGLHRRLRAALPEGHLAPATAAFGLLATSVVMVMSTALDTEFVFAATDPDSTVPEAFALYGHWVNTVPGCWMLVGLTGLALFSAARAGGVARWLGWSGLLLGGLTLLVGIAPVQYMAGLTGALLLLVVSIGFLAGDRAGRGIASA